MLAIRIALFSLALTLALPLASAAPPQNKGADKGKDQECLLPWRGGMKSGAGKSISIDPGQTMRPARTASSAARTATPTSKSFPIPPKLSKSNAHLPCG